MGLIHYQFNLYLFFIFLCKFCFLYDEMNLFIIEVIRKTIGIYSIQCCTGADNTCLSKPVDCHSNICFKLGKKKPNSIELIFIKLIC